MTRWLALPLAGAVTIFSAGSLMQARGVPARANRGQQHQQSTAPPASQQAFLDTYCITCHNHRLKTAGLELETLDLSRPAGHADVWEKVLRKVRTGTMPPPRARRPDPGAGRSFVASLEGALDRAASAHPDPGRVPAVHRLNRTEFQNAIRDLLALDSLPKELDISLLLPPDEIGEGFDNMADALYVSPTLIERYLGAARKISRFAVGDPAPPRMVETYQMSGQLPQDRHFDELPFGTRGGVLIERSFPVDGQYTFAVQVARGGVYDPSTAAESSEIELTIDGQRVKVFTEEAAAGGAARSGRRAPGGGALQAQLPVKAGPHEIGVAFLAKAAAPIEALVVPYRRGRGVESAALSTVTISGPDQTTGLGDTPSRRRIFVCRPADAPAPGALMGRDETACADRIVSTLARRAFRRPVTRADVKPLLVFYEQGRSEGGFELGIRRALERLLVSPEFLFRMEFDPPGIAADTAYQATDLQLASRLSFFFWSSIPDDELLDLAGSGQLKRPRVLQAQVHRMLADPRAHALVENFAGQWLYLRDFVAVKHPDDRLFPDFDEGLRQAMARETELFFAAMIHENRSVFDLLNADFTFLNERLARHYDIAGVSGS